MRTLEQIANENYAEHTQRDVDVLRQAQRETVSELALRFSRVFPDSMVLEIIQSFVDEECR